MINFPLNSHLSHSQFVAVVRKAEERGYKNPCICLFFIVLVCGASFVRKCFPGSFFSGLLQHAPNDNRISSIGDSQCAHRVVFSTRCAQLSIIAPVLKDTSSGQHDIVFYFRFSLSKAVGENDQLRIALSDLQSQLVPQHILSAFPRTPQLQLMDATDFSAPLRSPPSCCKRAMAPKQGQPQMWPGSEEGLPVSFVDKCSQ